MASVKNNFDRREKKFVLRYRTLRLFYGLATEENAQARPETLAEFGFVSSSTGSPGFGSFSHGKARRNTFSGRFRDLSTRARAAARCRFVPSGSGSPGGRRRRRVAAAAASTVSQGSRRGQHVACPAAQNAPRVCSRRHVPHRVRRIFRFSECAPVYRVFTRFAAVRTP